jgi:hypothetical protein
MAALDIVQRTYSDDGSGDGRYLPVAAAKGWGEPGSLPSPKPPLIMNLMGVIEPGRAEVTARVNEAFDRLIAYAGLPRQKRPRGGSDPDAYTSALASGSRLLGILLPGLGSVIQSEDQIATELAGTRLMFAIELLRTETGTPPDSLEQLVPGVLPAIPRDPFSIDGRFRYRQSPGDPAGRPYLLYSVGGDGADNGGIANPFSNFIGLNPAKGKGSDFIINAPR